MSNKSMSQRMQTVFAKDPSIPTNILSQVKGNRLWITFNRPRRYNAFTSDMYGTLSQIITYGNQNEQVKFIIIKGSGSNYSSGNDLGNFSNPNIVGAGNLQEIAAFFASRLRELTRVMILSKKPIFAITQGKVIGFAFTQLALFDRVYAVEGSIYRAPLVQLAQGQEMCSSVTFPKRFGKFVGQDLIMKGTTVDSAFLQKHGFAQRAKNYSQAQAALNKHLKDLQQLQWNSYLKARDLFRAVDRQQLLRANDVQCDNLIVRWVNPDLPAHLMNYMQKIKEKSKL